MNDRVRIDQSWNYLNMPKSKLKNRVKPKDMEKEQ